MASHESNTPPPAPPEPPTAPPPSAPARGVRLPTLLVSCLLSAALAAGGAWFVSHRLGDHDHASGSASQADVYHCPMHPTVIQDHPGNCPICGMKLVKIARDKAEEERRAAEAPASGASASATGTSEAPPHGLVALDIDPARQQLIGLATEAARVERISGTLRTVGRVVVDETRVRRVNVKVAGFVEKIFVDFVGKRVRRGDPLFALFSPELVAAEDEYLLALRTGALAAGLTGGAAAEGSRDAFAAAARRKLELWDVPETTLERLAQTRKAERTLTFTSPVAGVVTRKDIVQGARVEVGATPYEVVDLSQVWVLADVYERELGFAKEGLVATLVLNAFPGREFTGKVSFVDPLLDPATRTVKLRIGFSNPTGELRPEMFGEVVLHGAPRDQVVTIPADAVIDSGTGQVVFVASGGGKFSPRRVRVGTSDGPRVEIAEGLAAGERVVTRANFLIDSESRLRASLAGFGGPAPAPGASTTSARVLPGSDVHAAGGAR